MRWLVALLLAGGIGAEEAYAPPEPEPVGAPERYTCEAAVTPPVIDGRLDEAVWEAAAWSRDFRDIRGGDREPPPLCTRVRMLRDATCLYIGAELEEPHVWATLTERDSVIFHDNDFEVFIDPDGDTHLYAELEINALGTEWDLLLVKPYRDGGPALTAWNLPGLRTAVHVDGTLNDPSDEDRGWSVEIAIPWEALAPIAGTSCPPEPGDRPWRVNFSRVEWHVRVEDGRYVKEQDPTTGQPRPEENWVWSPQGLVNMHYPERWGHVHLADGDPPLTDDESRWLLRRVYYRQRRHHARHGSYTTDLAALSLPDLEGVELSVTPDQFEAVLPRSGTAPLRITQDGRIW
jgi:hypothetical protein